MNTAQLPTVKIIMLGNLAYLKELEKKYGNSITIKDLIHLEKENENVK